MKKNVAKMVMAVSMAGAMLTGQATDMIPLPIGQMQQVQAAQVQRQTVAAGLNHVAVIKEDGSLWTWGRNEYGQLGDGTTEDRYTPIKIMDDAVFVSAGNCHTAAIKSDGSLWVWGDNYHNYHERFGTAEARYSPIKVMDNVVSVSANSSETIALKDDDTLWAWGYCYGGKGGDDFSHSHQKVMNDVAFFSFEGISGTINIIKKDGSFCYGYFDDDFLYVGNDLLDFNDIISISSSANHTTTIRKDGTLWAWGSNYYGQLGDGTTEDRYSPVKIMDGVMLPSGVNAIAPKKEQSPQPPAEQTQQPTTPKANYIYGEEEKEVVLSVDELNQVETAEDAQKAAEEVAASMSENDKTSVDGADKAVLFTNEAITRASVVKTSSNSIVINDEMLEETVSKANDAEQKVAQAFSGVRKIRSSSKNARIVTSSEDKISIQKENISKDIDNVEVTTNYAKVSFPAKSVSEISIENKGTNKIAVDFGNKNTTEKVQISFPNMDKNKKYIAVVDENGNAIGGKYNPITGELSAKIEKSGIYTVVDNEKNFEDIKDKSAEMQEAIKLLASKGIISGTSETKFSPDKSISRAEVAAIILRTLSKLDQNADGNFSDVTKQNWYFGVAGSAKNTGIISGYPDNTFRGNIVIPKVQIVSVTSRVLKNEMNYFDVNDAEKILSVYGDSSNIAKWAKNDVALATDVNMVIRRTDSLFGGNDDMTRGDAAIILKRLFDKIW